ncbi:MAG: hypothetical protein H0V18_14760 [Pyrinomonadaceae bacterium]|jgi:hypothetical protein|nr:hypothetical protein [Pyrinomonadaceae bacterium]
MNKNRIGGIRRRTSWQLTTKSISIKGAGCKSGGGALKAVELTSGDLLLVAESRLREERSNLKRQQKSAEGIVVTGVMKARTVLRKEAKESGK